MLGLEGGKGKRRFISNVKNKSEMSAWSSRESNLVLKQKEIRYIGKESDNDKLLEFLETRTRFIRKVYS